MPEAGRYGPAFTRAEDGLFHCTQEGCDRSYKMPQHMGLHLKGAHGIEGQSSAARYRRERLEQERRRPVKTVEKRTLPRAVAATNGHRKLDAEEVCQSVMAGLVPSGSMRVSALGAYVEWVKATQTFLEALR